MIDHTLVALFLIVAFAAVAGVLAMTTATDDDEEPLPAERPAVAVTPRLRAPPALGGLKGGLVEIPAPTAASRSGEAGRVLGARRSDAPTRPVFLSVSAGDAQFEPASVQGGALVTRFSVKNDEVELKGSFKLDIAGGDDGALKQRVIRYRTLLLAILQRSLRNGPPVRSAPPVVSSLKLVAGSSDQVGLDGDDGFLGTFAGNTLVVCAARHDKVSLLAWNELDGPPKPLYDVGEHRVITLKPSPDGARLAMILGAARKTRSAIDPMARLLVVDAVSGASRVLLEAGETFRFHVSPRIAWSIGADRVAVEGITPNGRTVKVLDPATGAAVGETVAPLGATLIGWERDDRDAVILSIKGAWHHWRPGGTPERIHLPFTMSPDTRFMLVVRDVPVEEGGERAPALDIVRRDQGSWASMEGEDPDELARDMLLKDVLEHRVHWIGEHGAVMYGPEPMVLDLSSLATRYLVPPMPGVTLVSSSPSGKVVVRDGDGHLLWGTAAWT